jgi:hypothetical protein
MVESIEPTVGRPPLNQQTHSQLRSLLAENVLARGWLRTDVPEWDPENPDYEPGFDIKLLVSYDLTFFPDQKAQSMRVARMTLPELAELIQNTTAKSKAELPWLKFAIFGNKRTDKNCLRHNDNVQEITGIELDYDAKRFSFDLAVEVARHVGLQALLYTSGSHTESAPKWRILLPTWQPLPPDQRAKLVARVNGVFAGIFDDAS